ncbi:MAG: hypothetical protein A2X34_02940 [Elusimicrobia bacterium GWC2_51_8]|nr:MAG: hypothetical protein A2X34_02940 [Elusimicrobia bacterium GWC2_51_8]
MKTIHASSINPLYKINFRINPLPGTDGLCIGSRAVKPVKPKENVRESPRPFQAEVCKKRT